MANKRGPKKKYPESDQAVPASHQMAIPDPEASQKKNAAPAGELILDDLLKTMQVRTADAARRLLDDLSLMTADKAYNFLQSQGRLPDGLTKDQFGIFYNKIMG